MDKTDRILNDHSKTLAVRKNPCSRSMLNQLYEQRSETGDIKFIIDSEEIPAHRCVLAALSPKYKAQFYGPLYEKDVIRVKDVSPAAFREFLQFFYMDEVTLTVENIEDVLNLAKQSLVDELVTECINFLLDVIGLDKLISFYRLAIDNEIERLEEFCINQISAKIESVFQTPDFLHCEHEMLCHVLDLDSLNCDEISVFDACISWAQAKCKQEGLNTSDTANLRAALGNAIFKIRFCSMTAKQFATIDKGCSGLLSERDLNEVYRTIALRTNGETSSVFGVMNSEPRRFLPPSSIQNDWMNFYCDNAISLNGFVICNKIDGFIDVLIEISGVPQRFDFNKSMSDNETKIIFDNPIHVQANKWCRIHIESNTSIVGCDGFNIVNSVQHSDASFQFEERLCNYLYSITRLLYNTYTSIESIYADYID